MSTTRQYATLKRAVENYAGERIARGSRVCVTDVNGETAHVYSVHGRMVCVRSVPLTWLKMIEPGPEDILPHGSQAKDNTGCDV